MLEAISPEARLELEKWLPKKCKRNDPKRYLPTNLPYQGKIEGPPGATPPDEFLQCIRMWLLKRGETKVLYFITEFADGDEINFLVDIDNLNYQSLLKVNPFGENIIAAQDYSWLLYMHHEGIVYVAGPKELFDLLVECWEELD